ncbi:MAG TPA: DUF2163 domain-containing protein [Sphingomicrobium sp.]|jgi:uncharacterized phage protein (TIGR02218 family)|nr:DUF2163 domain-containing protein [Sphingomicrobium sp.]
MGSELTALAFCWRLERRDGAGHGLTSHDRELTIEGIRYEPAPGMTPAAVRSVLGLEPGSSEVAGSLSTEAISERDIVAGRWDGAALKLFAVDWAEPAETIVLLDGEVGQVSTSDGAFEAELKGAAAQLERPVCPLTSPNCRAELGDPRCRVDMAGRKLRATVVGTAAHVVTVDLPVDGRFQFGEIRFLNGAANGERRTILSVEDQQLHLRSAPAGEVAAGTAVEIVEGCDKLIATCSQRFSNAANFRGEPHLPGNDLLTRYPGA